VSDETLSRIAGWCEAAPDLEMDGSTVTVAGDRPIEISIESNDDAVVLNHTHAVDDVHEDFAEQAKALLGGRGSMLEGDLTTDKGGTRVEVRYPIYLDGLNRQTFLLAIRDITGTADSLSGISGATPAATQAAEPATEPKAEPEAEETEAAPAEEPAAEPEAATAETVVVDEAAMWVATHTVPGGGISAWAEPDPGLAPVAKLAARVELQVNEQRGAWASVTGSNGWTGWVDARKLRKLEGAATARVAPASSAPVAAAAAVTTARAGGLTLRPLALLGGLAMIIAAFLPWNATGTALDGTYSIPFGKALDWPLAFVWNSLSPSQPSIGIVAVVLALIVLALAVLPKATPPMTIAAGSVAALVGILFLLQLSRLPGWGDALKILEVGFWVFLVGAVLAAIPFKMKI